MSTTTDPAAGYQYFWWIDEEHDAFYAQGQVLPDDLRTSGGRSGHPPHGEGLRRDLLDWLRSPYGWTSVYDRGLTLRSRLSGSTLRKPVSWISSGSRSTPVGLSRIMDL